ncbi:MAG: response regulator [Longimicrobiales bacterium]
MALALLDPYDTLTPAPRQDPAVVRSEPFSPGKNRSGDRQLVLVIEDNPHDWEIYGKILWYNGYDVLYASEGPRGLSLAHDSRPDLVLLDLALPGLDGLELCRQLKADEETSHAHVVALTARAKRECENEAIAAGVEYYLEKPIGPIEVLRVVADLIGRPPLPGEGRLPKLGPHIPEN